MEFAGYTQPWLRCWGSGVGYEPTAFATEFALEVGINVNDAVRSGSVSATATSEKEARGRGVNTGLLPWWWRRRGPAGETPPKQDEARCLLYQASGALMEYHARTRQLYSCVPRRLTESNHRTSAAAAAAAAAANVREELSRV